MDPTWLHPFLCSYQAKKGQKLFLVKQTLEITYLKLVMYTQLDSTSNMAASSNLDDFVTKSGKTAQNLGFPLVTIIYKSFVCLYVSPSAYLYSSSS